MSTDEQALLQAYADGVNAYLADHKGAALSLEYAVLKAAHTWLFPGTMAVTKYSYLGESHGMGPSPARERQKSNRRSY